MADSASIRVATTIRIRITSDHAFLLGQPRQCSTEQQSLQPVGELGDGIEPEQLVKERSLDLEIVLLDSAIPRTDTVDPINAERELSPGARIVVLRCDLSDEHSDVADSLDGEEYHSIRTLFATLQIVARSLQAEFATPPYTAIRPPHKPHSMSVSRYSPTRRELDVLTLVAEGKSDREAAAVLGLSKRTINFHVRNLFNKADVTSRTALVRHATQHEWLS